MLRPYQQAAFDAAVKWLSKSIEPCLIEAATGSGKSHVIAAIAEWVSQKSGGRVLCLAPSAELVEQNHQKYLAIGEPASIFSAKISKSLRHDVVFGTPLTVLNSIDRFCDRFSGVIIDEAHGITPTIRSIIEHLKNKRPKLRIVGLSATPYRMNTGYIYKYDENGEPVPEAETLNPYFNTLIYRITAHELIGMGYLTPPTTESVNDHYDTSTLVLNNRGNFEGIDQAFEGKGRKTSAIVADIVEKSRNRQGVIIFAASTKHAKEVMESLPPELSALITGDTKNRSAIIKRFKQKKIKYLVNCQVLTTGFDAPHIDVVAILRATESAGLLQQIIGRGLRLDEGKKDCLVLDYAENIERHSPDGDIFNPQIKAKPPAGPGELIKAKCPECYTTNHFQGRPNPEGFLYDQLGYFVDLAGNQVLIDDKPMPGHYGRRCLGQTMIAGESHQCNYRWSYKACPDCETENDIAARECSECGCELVDPNEKLRLEFSKIKADPYSMSTDKVINWQPSKHISRAGNDTLKINYTTEYRTFSTWYLPTKKREWNSLCLEVFGKIAPSVDAFLENYQRGRMPRTLTVKRERDSKFYSVYDHGRPEDAMPN